MPKRSKVWAHFTPCQDVRGPVCNYCNTTVLAKGGNTSNLLKHLRVRHALNLHPGHVSDPQPAVTMTHEVLDSSQAEPSYQMTFPEHQTDTSSEGVPISVEPQTSQSLVTSLTKKNLSQPRRDLITTAISRYLVKDALSLSVVDSGPFRTMVNRLNPHYILPNQFTLSTVVIPAWYEAEKNHLMNQLSSVPFVGITADHWTTTAGEHYRTITSHYVDGTWTLQNTVLETKAVYETRNGSAVAQEIGDCLAMFGIREKIVAITSGDVVNKSDDVASFDVLKLPCFAQAIKVAVGKLYEEALFAQWIGRIRAVAAWFKQVHVAPVILQEKQRLLGMRELQVLLDVNTRWDSLYFMVKRFSELYPVLVATCHDLRLKKKIDSDKLDIITNDDWTKCQEFTDTMKILYTSTIAISNSEKPTIGQIIPLLSKLKASFAVHEHDSVFKRMIKETMWTYLEITYKSPDVKQFLEEATALDPRFKHYVAEDLAVWDRLAEKAGDRYKVTSAVTIKQEPGVSDTVIEGNKLCVLVDQDESPPKKCALEELFGDDDVVVTAPLTALTPEAMARLEVQRYRLLPSARYMDDPLSYFKNSDLLMLPLLAKKYFSVPGNSLPSERIFSLIGQTTSQERARIDSENVDMLIFLQKNAE